MVPKRWRRVRTIGGNPTPDGSKPRYCGRGTILGNDYIVRCGSKKEKHYYVVNPKTGYISNMFYSKFAANEHAAGLYKDIKLRQMDIQTIVNFCKDYTYLSCFCPLDMPCHVDPLIELLNRMPA